MTRAPGHGRVGAAFAALGILASLALATATFTVGLPPTEPDSPAPPPAAGRPEHEPAPTGGKPNGPQFDPVQANLVTTEEQRLFGAVEALLPGTPARDVPAPGGGPATLALPAQSAPYDLAALTGAGAVQQQPDGGFLLVRNVLVGPGAQLNLSIPSGTLRLSSSAAGITSIITFKGSMIIGGGPNAPLTITSWDPTTSTADTDPSNGRAYIRDVGGRMDLHDLNTTGLGFWSGRTGGVAWTGSTSEAATGSARNVNFTGNHYGMFSSRTKGLLINGAQVRNSMMDGIAVHTNSEGMELWRVTSTSNSANGIAIAQGAHDISIREVTAASNARNGIYLNGAPRASGPTVSGSATTAASGFTINASTARGNAEHGILVNNAYNAQLSDNAVAANRDGIVVRGDTQGVVLRGNHVSSPGGYAVAIRNGSRGALIDRNSLSDALTAVQVNNANAQISGNEIDGMTVHAVSIIGNSGGSSVTDNRVAGRGPSSIDLNRVGFADTVDVSGNDEKNWTVDHDDAQYISNFVRKHPLTLLWFLTLLLPTAARAYFKRKYKLRRLGTHPYPATQAAMAAATAATPDRPPAPPRLQAAPPRQPSHPHHPGQMQPGRPPARQQPPGRPLPPGAHPYSPRPGHPARPGRAQRQPGRPAAQPRRPDQVAARPPQSAGSPGPAEPRRPGDDKIPGRT